MMKKLILGLFLFIAALSLKAQTNHYPNDTGTVTGSGYTYKYEKRFGGVTLYNVENRFTNVEWAMKDGSPITDGGIMIGDVRCFEKDDWTRQKSFSIVKDVIHSLPSADGARLNGHRLSVLMRIDTSTGKVFEVEFDFLDNGPFRYVPVSIYRKIETDLKSQIWFTLTPAGKTLNYCMVGWTQTIR